MASYGTIYEFRFDDINGDDVDIFIAKKNYTGSVTRRALGRTPILKRERSGNILGTSLEIYAECRVDGEFAQLYTSSADEFRVEVYKRQNLLWRGFVSPELYSEPDIAPPYDVQIIATDGLGELKNYDFIQGSRPRSFLGHLNAMLAHTNLDLGVEAVSDLQYYDDGWSNGVLSIVVDLQHKESEDCYSVLQSLLASVNACITVQDAKWAIIRETDLYNNISRIGSVAFGSMANCEWWPIGNLSADIIPAARSLSLVSENQYRDSVLLNSAMTEDASWQKELNAFYDQNERAYLLPDSGSTIRQGANFNAEVGYQLLLRISARNLGNVEAQMIGVAIKINGRLYQAGSEFWLAARAEDKEKFLWSNQESYVEFELPASSESDSRSAAKNIEIVIPLYKYDNRSYAYATAMEVTIFNSTGSGTMAVYQCSLSQYEQYKGNKIDIRIGNGAREDAGSTDLLFNDGEFAQPAAEVFRTSLPLAYSSEAIIKKWQTASIAEDGYLSVLGRDYAMQVALPRMRYRGKLNVPSLAFPRIPMLFERDNTYYFLNTYSYDLLNSELEVELISIPNAQVQIESETVTELPSSGSGSASSSGGSTGGGGTSGGGGSDIVVDSAMSDTSTNPVQNKVVKKYVDDQKADAIKVAAAYTVEAINGMKDNWFDDKMSDDSRRGVRNYVIKAYVDGKYDELAFLKDMFYWADDAHTVIGTKYPFFSENTVTAGGRKTEEDSGGGGGGITITDVADYLEQQGYATEQWVADQNYATNSALKSLSDKVDSIENNGVDLSGYATEQWVKAQGYATEQWVKDQKYATEEALKDLSDKVDGLPDTDIDLTGYATEQWVKDQGYVTSTSLEPTFSGIDTRLKALEKLLDLFEFDEAAQMIKAKFGIYSVGAITAAKKKEEE